VQGVKGKWVNKTIMKGKIRESHGTRINGRGLTKWVVDRPLEKRVEPGTKIKPGRGEREREC